MSVLDSILVAMFTLTLVFVVLAVLCILIMLFSRGLNMVASKSASDKADTPAVPAAATVPDVKVDAEADFSSGELKLKGVDERTAAMIMAIVSDESGIPLSELCFKSIKEIPNEKM